VLDGHALSDALKGAQADAVIAELTALKRTPMRHRDMAMTNRLRVEGTANLLEVAGELGATRFITQSMVFGYGFGDWHGRVLTEADPFGPPGKGRFEQHLSAMRSNEQQVIGATGLTGIALRYGLFYGPGPASDGLVDQLRQRRLPVVRGSAPLPWVQVDDAAAATIAALSPDVPGGAYNIVDDLPVSMSDLLMAMAAAVGAPAPRIVPRFVLAALPYAKPVMLGGLRLSNSKAKADFGWVLQLPTYRDGLAALATHYP
jgi:nucleoside-diphosphate-sugar epimerase